MGCGGAKASQAEPAPVAAGGAAPNGAAAPGGAKKPNEKLLDKYVLGAVLGQGAFGVVYACHLKGGSKEEFAVKMIDKVETSMADIKQEIDMLYKCKHPCVVELYDTYFEKVFIYLVLQVVKGGDMIAGMQAHWKAKGMIPMDAVKCVAAQMCEGCQWLHGLNVVHRDIKGDNYLMTSKQIENPDVKVLLSDFGTVLDMPVGKRLNKSCGTKIYWSPEFYALSYGLKVDIWAIGVVSFGLVTGKFPFRSEADTKSKAIVLPSRCPAEGQKYVTGMLCTDENKRFDAKAARGSKWFADQTKIVEDVSTLKLEDGFKTEVEEAGANAGVKDRRRELVERLENAAQAKVDQVDGSQDKNFSVINGRTGKSVKFEWWPESKVNSDGKVTIANAMPAPPDDMVKACEFNTKAMLKNHGINLELFGKGQAKSWDEFINEIQNGSARLMLDAAKHKCLVRVVDLVCLRLRVNTPKGVRFLIKTEEIRNDRQAPLGGGILPGTKKLAEENPRQTAMRVIKERLKMTDCSIKLEYNKTEFFEEEEDSPSYPGVLTVYRKEIVDGTVTATDASILKKVGADGGATKWTTVGDTDQTTRSYQWFDEATITKEKIKLRAPPTGEISTLVYPPTGLEKEELEELLRTNNVDASAFGKNGTKSLAEFSDELCSGQAALVKQKNGQLIRLVDVVIAKIVNKQGMILMEVAEVSKDGTQKIVNRLPAVKRRADEHQCLAAHRVFSKVLMMDPNMAELKTDNIMVLEDKTDSASYPGVLTMYQKRIITANFTGKL